MIDGKQNLLIASGFSRYKCLFLLLFVSFFMSACAEPDTVNFPVIRYTMVKHAKTNEPIEGVLVIRWWSYFEKPIIDDRGYIREHKCTGETLVNSGSNGQLPFPEATFKKSFTIRQATGHYLEISAHKPGFKVTKYDQGKGVIFMDVDNATPEDRANALLRETLVGCSCGKYQRALVEESDRLFTPPFMYGGISSRRMCNYSKNIRDKKRE
jgi:hypothetical protein